MPSHSIPRRKKLNPVYDIVGDIHGHADDLRELLKLLGYEERNGFYSHPVRKAVFVGDFIDRGPKIRDALNIVCGMVDNNAALAVMGNHEFNAIAYHSPIPGFPGRFFREHSQKNTHQHVETLRQLSEGELSDAIDWFKTLPVSLDLGGIRIVHACWDDVAIQTIERSLQTLGRYTPEFLAEATAHNPPSELFQAVEKVLKGPEVELPGGTTYTDKDGNQRRRMRVKWFEPPDGKTYLNYEMPIRGRAPDTPVPTEKITRSTYPATDPPVVFGHYWLTDTPPSVLAPNIACVDYSVAANGELCAYRWHANDRILNDESFVAAKSNAPNS